LVQGLQENTVGERGNRVRSQDWVATPLGQIEIWPQSLKTVVAVLLATRPLVDIFSECIRD
jgi:hypothetical protein